MEEQNKHIEIERTILRFLNGDTTHEEEKELLYRLESDSEFKTMFVDMQEAYLLAQARNIDSDTAFDNFITRVEKSKKKLSIKSILKVAAILIMGLMVYQFLPNQHKKDVIIASNDKLVSKILPDGTKIILNKSSQVSIDKNFNIKNRILHLNGDAHFDVVQNTNLPFIVKSGSLNIIVVGTSFTVSHSASNEKTEVYVENGNVALTPNSKALKETLHKIANSLKAGEFREELFDDVKVIGKGTSAVHSDIKEELTVSLAVDGPEDNWKTRLFKYQNRLLPEVLNNLELVFNTKYNILSEDLLTYKVTANFNEMELQDIHILLEAALSINITEKNGFYEVDKASSMQ
jgi:ferric-dicitrate binding protein FerR (iron transport regulator)